MDEGNVIPKFYSDEKKHYLDREEAEGFARQPERRGEQKPQKAESGQQGMISVFKNAAMRDWQEVFQNAGVSLACEYRLRGSDQASSLRLSRPLYLFCTDARFLRAFLLDKSSSEIYTLTSGVQIKKGSPANHHAALPFGLSFCFLILFSI